MTLQSHVLRKQGVEVLQFKNKFSRGIPVDFYNYCTTSRMHIHNALGSTPGTTQGSVQTILSQNKTQR